MLGEQDGECIGLVQGGREAGHELVARHARRQREAQAGGDVMTRVLSQVGGGTEGWREGGKGHGTRVGVDIHMRRVWEGQPAEETQIQRRCEWY